MLFFPLISYNWGELEKRRENCVYCLLFYIGCTKTHKKFFCTVVFNTTFLLGDLGHEEYEQPPFSVVAWDKKKLNKKSFF